MTRLNRIVLTGWTLLAAALGLQAIALRWWSDRRDSTDGATVTIVSVFEATTRRTTSPAFRGGWVVSVFGRTHLDLRRACLSPDGANLRALTVFGDTEITHPEGWRVKVGNAPPPGADQITQVSSHPAADPLFHITGRALFGNLEVVGRPVLRTASEI